MTTSNSTGGDMPAGPGRGPALAVRRAVPADARTIAEIGVIGWRAAYRGILPDDFLAGLSVDVREIAWRSLLETDPEGRAPTWIAERGGRAVGFVASGPPRDDDVPPPAAEVYALYVRPEAWRTGAGSTLLSTAVDHWRAGGATTLVLWVLQANGLARSFYESQGWRPDGASQPLDLGGFVTTEVRYLIRPRP
jgi:GNAT superfamily N-acetyltransferase